MFRQMHNITQKIMLKNILNNSIGLKLQLAILKDDGENVDRYINGLRFDIQVEINLLSPKTIEKPYQFPLKVKEKL